MKVRKKSIFEEMTYEAWRVNRTKPRPDWVQEALDKKELIFPWDWENPKSFSMRPAGRNSANVVPAGAYGFGKTVAYENDILVHRGRAILTFTDRTLYLKNYKVIEEENDD
ncbi:MAG: hypothetical protein LBI11_02335 [Streptococcaceae bacterium]|jgi:hypothetical protein|nr:hypothetical protein [Streptococcaceae bacterium]